jgi:cytochrome c551/c552
MGNQRKLQRSLGFFTICPAVIILAGGVHALAQGVASQPTALGNGSPAVEEEALLKKYCVTCHNEKRRTAGLSLENVNPNDASQNGAVLEKVVRKLATGAMPPASAPRPDKATLTTLRASLERCLDRAAAAHPNPGRPMMLHRLNRTEYLNSVRDLLDVDLSPEDASLLPADDTSFGFDNNGDVLGLSPLLLERYLSVANRVTNAALGPTSSVDVDVYSHREEFTAPQREWKEGLPFGTRGGTFFTYRFPVDGEYTIGVKLQRSGGEGFVIGLDEPKEGEPVRPQRMVIGLDGGVVAQFAIGPYKTVRESLSVSPNDLGQSSEVGKKISSLELEQRKATADDGIEVRLFVKAGVRRISAAFIARFEPIPNQLLEPLASGTGGPPRLLGVDKVLITGPYKAVGSSDTASKRRVLTCRPEQASDETPCARTILSRLSRLAYRRPVIGSDLDELLTAYGQGRQEGSFEAGVATGLRRMLMDPAFLFRLERDPTQIAPNTPYQISDLELASRLSFFLWSSIPDDQLLKSAEQGRLSNSEVLQAQVRRMLADPRAHSLVTNFAAQWLQLQVVEGVHPDPILFSDFDSGLRKSFERETEMFLEDVLLGDRSVLELLNANYTFVNERLARHYGIAGVYGDQFRRVKVTDGIRGGLLGQGSILTATSYPTRTSPVLRGKWILDTLLGSPPPPPPPDVPALPEATATGKVLSVRERLSEHRKNPACAGCHARMDPLGFALENFDASGKWRTAESAGPADYAPQVIDASGQLPDGTKFDGVAGLRHMLQERSDQFVYAMTEKLLTFALGRGADWYDAPAIREVVRAGQKDDYRFFSLVTSIVNSTPFKMRMSQGTENSVQHSAQRRGKLAGISEMTAR